MNEIKAKVDYNEISFSESHLYQEFMEYLVNENVEIVAEAQALHFHKIVRRY